MYIRNLVVGYLNHHLTEVMCAFTFKQGEVGWDATYFGNYFDKIKELGFINKQERKGIQVQFSNNVEELLNPQKPFVQELSSQIIYKNDEQGKAIVLGEKQISFHVIKDYKLWDNFFKDLIVPAYNKYLELGLNNKLQTCQVTYLNKFIIKENEELSKYFTLIQKSLSDEGTEEFTLIDTRYKTKKNIVLNPKLIAGGIEKETKNRIINMECTAIAVLTDNINIDWVNIANDVHEPIRNFFEKSITDTLRQTL